MMLVMSAKQKQKVKVQKLNVIPHFKKNTGPGAILIFRQKNYSKC